MSGHTKGPWEADDCEGYSIWRVFAPGRIILAQVVGDSAETDANARLIAASPTMYEYVARKAAEGDADAARIIASI